MLKAILIAASLLAVGLAVAEPATANHAQGQLPTVRFDHRTGNEWWVEVIVTTDPGYRVDEVLATDDGVTWTPLTLRSWGAWAGSFHIEPGNHVKFQAAQTTTTSGSDGWRIYSCFFSHPAGEEVDCADGGTTPFGATFTKPSGNEWWQQIYVSGNKKVDGVFVSIDNGPRKALSLRSWGAWAGSYHAPSGSIVQFVATSGQEETRSDCYRWPDAVAVSCTQQPPPHAPPRFDHRTGNEWWVEVVVKDATPKRVLASDEGGPWHELTLRSWGAWASSFHIEPGHDVRFEVLVGERWYDSCWFTHPQGVTPTGGQTCEGVLLS